MTPKELVLTLFMAVFTDHDPETARQVTAPDYIQHNPQVPTGAEGLLGLIPIVEQAGVTVKTHRVITEGDLVVLHNTYENAEAFGASSLAAFDVFRVQDGKVVEHWDNLQPVPEVTASGRGMTDGPTEITDLDQTQANKELVVGFVRDVLGGAAPEKVTNYMDPAIYMQHNPSIKDGLAGLMAAIEAFAAQGQVITKFEPQLVVAEGNFVFVASDATMGGEPWAFFDLWRVENGKIVEHWDVVSPTPAEMAHENGKF
ncbi:nuclear transport factor 2 family protein [Pseudovibrio brasiliensis]|uniref:Nuclear transport factor 2 family protein n=1 Tax=Pseudovibrio brasiliensis TaxID=1898042 RepID=A0ABX8AQI8_9HYPH|nr:nuclear transport factor 2 family protein [Pseudovibrio brasiliensis]QUS55466.1 nuclear transport factor 2 family protein [Pseudovibrio brasiliensis]